MNGDETPDLEAIAGRLDRLRHVPDDVLADLVTQDGLCPWLLRRGALPDWDDCAPSDRELAARLCEGCPVVDQCLELELRTEGQTTTGVWGALPEDDRRALHRVWRHRRATRAADQGEEGPTG